jgi:hypothetical protein
VRKEVNLREYNFIPKLPLQYGSETWAQGEEGKRKMEASQVKFLRPLLCVSLRKEIRSKDRSKQSGTERIVEEIQDTRISK